MNLEDEDDQDRSNYHEIMINQDQEDNQKKIYNQKYFCMLITIIMVYLSSRFERELLQYNGEVIYSIHLSVIAAFLITSMSSYLGIITFHIQGHKRVFIISYCAQIFIFYLLNIDGLQDSLFIWFYYYTAKQMLFTQIFIQICGTWPENYIRILTELSILTIIITQLISSFPEHMLIIEIILVIVLIGNFVLILKNVKSYKQPSTNQIHKDFANTITSLKVVIFTTLCFSSLYLNVSTNHFLKKYQVEDDEIYMETSKVIYVAAFYLFLLCAYLIRNKKFQVDKVVLITFVLQLLLGIIVYFSLVPDDFIEIFQLIRLALQFYQICFFLPQYQLILTNIGINNLDFVSSLHTLSKGIGLSTVYAYSEYKFYDTDIQDRLLYSMIVLGIFLVFHLIAERVKRRSPPVKPEQPQGEQELSIQQN